MSFFIAGCLFLYMIIHIYFRMSDIDFNASGLFNYCGSANIRKVLIFAIGTNS